MMEQTHEEDEHYVVKRNGQKEKIQARLATYPNPFRLWSKL